MCREQRKEGWCLWFIFTRRPSLLTDGKEREKRGKIIDGKEDYFGIILLYLREEGRWLTRLLQSWCLLTRSSISTKRIRKEEILSVEAVEEEEEDPAISHTRAVPDLQSLELESMSATYHGKQAGKISRIIWEPLATSSTPMFSWMNLEDLRYFRTGVVVDCFLRAFSFQQ